MLALELDLHVHETGWHSDVGMALNDALLAVELEPVLDSHSFQLLTGPVLAGGT